MASDLQAKLAEELTCKVCLDRYKDPRELPCQHSFCIRCLKNIKLVHIPLSCGGVGHGLSCPLCRQTHPVPRGGVEGYPKDFKLGSLLEMLNQHEKEGSSGEGRSAAPPPESGDGTPKGSGRQLPVSTGIPSELVDDIQQITLTESSPSTASVTQTVTSTDPLGPPAFSHPQHHWYWSHPHRHPPPHPPHPPHPHPPPHHPHPPHPHPPHPHHPHPPPHHPHPPHPHHPHPPPHHPHPHHRHHPHHCFGPHHQFRPRPPFPHGRGCHHHP